MIIPAHGPTYPIRLYGQLFQRRVLCWGSHMSQDAPSAPESVCSFTVQHTDGSARAGLLNGRPTPAHILYTYRGLPYSLTPDLMDALGPAAETLHLDASML